MFVFKHFLINLQVIHGCPLEFLMGHKFYLQSVIGSKPDMTWSVSICIISCFIFGQVDQIFHFLCICVSHKHVFGHSVPPCVHAYLDIYFFSVCKCCCSF